jgi:hypothetical protein
MEGQPCRGHLLGACYKTRHLSRCYNFVEQREHSRVAPHVVDVHEYGGAVNRGENFVPKLVSRIQVMGELVSRSNHCA